MAKQFKLPDGRNIDYFLSGAKEGFPLVYIHGTPGAYTPIPSFSAACEKKGIKVITLSRAGYGGSTRNKGRRVVDAVADIQALNEHLGVEQCFVAGWSGGGGFNVQIPEFEFLALSFRNRSAHFGMCSPLAWLCRCSLHCSR